MTKEDRVQVALGLKGICKTCKEAKSPDVLMVLKNPDEYQCECLDCFRKELSKTGWYTQKDVD